MTVKLLTPQMGAGVDQVTVVRWLKKEGDSLKELEPLVEVETDKVITEIPSPADGILLKIMVLENATSQVGETLAEIGTPEESKAPQGPVQSAAPVKTETVPPAKGKAGQPKPVTSVEKLSISPLVAKLAAENNLDLSLVKGSGQDGRVTKQDVLDYLANHPGQSVAKGTIEVSQPDLMPISSVRRQIAERMVHSMQTSAHVLTVMEADLSCILADQAKKKESFASENLHLTLTVYFISAIARALRTNPLVNSSWTEQGIRIHKQINVGMAVSLGDEGLIVPVIKNADALSFKELAHVIKDLAERARSKALQPEEVREGTFTLTNHGTGGSLFASPIINQPQTGILGTGALQKRPIVVRDGSGIDTIAIRPMIYLSFVFDHRILDGASADQFLITIKKILETQFC